MTRAQGTSPEINLNRRALILGTVFSSVAGVAWARRPTEQLNFLGRDKLENVVPKTIGPWKFVTASGLVVPPSDQLSQLIYSQLLTRVYSDGVSSPIMLLTAYSAGETGILQIHRPEVCYQAGGFTLSALTSNPINLGNRTLPTNRMDASSGGIDEHIVYWTRVGRELPASWAEQRLSIAKQNLLGLIPDAILVRVSMRGPDRLGSYAQLENFIRELIAAVPAARRSVFTD